jgi:hypothetical protein
VVRVLVLYGLCDRLDRATNYGIVMCRQYTSGCTSNVIDCLTSRAIGRAALLSHDYLDLWSYDGTLE